MLNPTMMRQVPSELPEMKAPRETQIRALVEAGATPSQAVRAAHRDGDTVTTLHVMGLHALLPFGGGWEATRVLAIELDVHPLAFATGWAEGFTDSEVFRLLGIVDRFVASSCGSSQSGNSQARTAQAIVAMRLGDPASPALPGDDEKETVLVEAVQDINPPTKSCQVPAASARSGYCRQRPSQGRTLIVYGPWDLGLQGGTARMSSLCVHGRLCPMNEGATIADSFMF